MTAESLGWASRVPSSRTPTVDTETPQKSKGFWQDTADVLVIALLQASKRVVSVLRGKGPGEKGIHDRTKYDTISLHLPLSHPAAYPHYLRQLVEDDGESAGSPPTRLDKLSQTITELLG